MAVASVTGPDGHWDEGGFAGVSAGDVPLEVRGDRRALARIVLAMLRSTKPYLASKFTAFEGWPVAVAALQRAAAGRKVVTSGWPALLLADAAGLTVDVHIAHNVDTLIAAAHSPRPLRLLGEARRLERMERRLLQRPRSVLALSSTDVARLRAWGIAATPLPLPLTPAHRAEPSVPGRSSRAGRDRIDPEPRTSRRAVGFIGKASWPPNADALEVLLGPVHVALTALGSDVRYVLGGSGTEAFADHPRVARAGWVEDLDAFYESIGSVVVPRLGVSTGVSVKMLEAAEHGVPAVVTQALADAVDPDGPWLVADTPSAVASVIAGEEGPSLSVATSEWAARQAPSRTAAAVLDRL